MNRFSFRLRVALFILAALLAGAVAPGAAPAASAAGASYADQNSEAVSLTALSATSARINWPAYAPSGYSFRIEMKEDEGAFLALSDLSSSHTEYVYSSVRVSAVYVFRLMLYNTRTGVYEQYFNEIVYKPPGTPLLPQALAFSQPSPSQIAISWEYPDSAGFETDIERRRGSEQSWTAVATVRAGVNRYTDTGLETNTQYTYRLRARYGRAVFSEYVSRTAYSTIDVPQITQFYSVSPSSVYIAWTPSIDALRYQLERRHRGEAEFASVAVVSNNRTEYTDSTIVPGERYAYRVKAIGSGGSESLYSDEAELAAVYIDISHSISATAVEDYLVKLRWADLGDRESSYEVWRIDEQYREWKLIATLDRNASQYDDSMVGPGETYTYRVRARSAQDGSYSRYSGETSAATKFLPAPDRLRQQKFSGTSITLTWRDNSSGESAFFIERRVGLGGQWSQVTIAEANAVKRDNLPVPGNTPCFYRVGAYSSEYRSVAYSEAIQADNGYAASLRGSSYGSEGDAAGTPSTGSGSGSGAGAAGAGSIGPINLAPDVVSALRR
ncbi:MAG: fibronectin type III domain-containing protein, partial [Oscillospiraceae bacterium]|nr:fibronectin type III domain-containing protein [Oscillospiraceae bacterium]